MVESAFQFLDAPHTSTHQSLRKTRKTFANLMNFLKNVFLPIERFPPLSRGKSPWLSGT